MWSVLAGRCLEWKSKNLLFFGRKERSKEKSGDNEMAAKRFTLTQVTLNSTVISGVKNFSCPQGIAEGIEAHDGEVDPRFGVVLEAKPMFRVRTVDVAGAIAAIGIGSLKLTTGLFCFQQCDNKGTRMSGSNHVTATPASGGIAKLNRLSVQKNRVAEVEFEVWPVSSDGLTNPFTWSASGSLPGAVAGFSYFTNGPVDLTVDEGAVSLPNVGWEFDAGITVESDADDGVVYPTFVSLMGGKPKFSLNVADLSGLVSVPAHGGAVAGDFYLRKLSASGGRVAGVTAEHGKISVASGLIGMDTADVTHDALASGGVSIWPVSNGTDPIVEFDWSSAIG